MVGGHGDSPGPAKIQLDIAELREQAVHDFTQRRGVGDVGPVLERAAAADQQTAGRIGAEVGQQSIGVGRGLAFGQDAAP